ncbi:MAG: ribonuclease catalytic domain-containing protein, partial [Myxococcota bacterium]|nr:ribonuclease catalytic domain-containing protein [Myxococcota bacterium]
MNDLDAIARRAMVQRGFLPDFSAAALAEVAALGAPPTGKAGPLPAVRDLRDRLWASIDNDSSRDLDQLSVAEPQPDGTTKIFVAIADVDASVRQRSAVDEHARVNTTSVYTTARIFPMLPERLSTDLTSLVQDEERLAIVVEMVIRADGTVAGSDVYRATVINRSKLAYDSVAAWLDGSASPPPPLAAVRGMDEQLRIQDRVATAMRALRFQHGALSLETPDAQPVFENGVLSDLRPEQSNRAKELIEDFMIAANGVTARYLVQHGFAPLRR